MRSIDSWIAIWSMRPQPGTPCGEAWEQGARWAASHWAPTQLDRVLGSMEGVTLSQDQADMIRTKFRETK
jgi:hypothetical protein